jgi:hypothetical protein
MWRCFSRASRYTLSIWVDRNSDPRVPEISEKSGRLLYGIYIDAPQQHVSFLYAFLTMFALQIRSLYMLDILFIAIGLAFLAGTMLYAAACDRL